MDCRILYLVGQLGIGGSERQLCYLLQAMDRERYKPAVVVWNYSPDDVYTKEITDLGVPIYSFPSGVNGAAKLRNVRHLAKGLDPEVIHSYSFYTNVAASWAALGTKAVALGSLRGDYARAKKGSGLWLGRLSARWPARRSMGIFSPKQIYVVRNGLDLHRFCSVNSSAHGKSRIVGVGSLLALKRWDRLLRIVQQVKCKGGDCRVRIAGEGPERNPLERQAQNLGISKCVEFIGTTSDVPELLGQSRFLVHTSDTEGCPNSVMEAMACGRAVIAMDAGDIPFLIEDGKSGFVVPRGDEAAFAQRVWQLLSDDELCCRMGLAARVKAEREFGLGRLVMKTLDAYKAAGWKG
jgi:glycosyltransferase involved in cell wall biosynthesis